MRGLCVVVLIIIAAAFASSCKSLKADDKRLEKIHARHEALTNDKLHKWFPEKPPTIKQGKTIVKTVVKEDVTKSKKLQDKINSLTTDNAGLNELLSQCPDELKIKHFIDSIKTELTDSILRECGTFQSDSVFVHDTAYFVPSETLAEIATLKADTSKYHDDNISLKTSLIAANGDTDYWRVRFFWLLAITVIYTGLSIFVAIKKLPAKLT